MILVVGSTGVLGGMITRRLLEQGHCVRILVRPGSGYQRRLRSGAGPSAGAAARGAGCATARPAGRGGPVRGVDGDLRFTSGYDGDRFGLRGPAHLRGGVCSGAVSPGERLAPTAR